MIMDNEYMPTGPEQKLPFEITDSRIKVLWEDPEFRQFALHVVNCDQNHETRDRLFGDDELVQRVLVIAFKGGKTTISGFMAIAEAEFEAKSVGISHPVKIIIDDSRLSLYQIFTLVQGSHDDVSNITSTPQQPSS